MNIFSTKSHKYGDTPVKPVKTVNKVTIIEGRNRKQSYAYAAFM